MANDTRKKPDLSDIACPAAGIGVFLVFYWVLNAALLLSAAAAAVTFAAVALLFRPNRFRFGRIQVGNEAEYRSVESIIGDGYQKMEELRGYAKTIREPSVAAQVLRIGAAGDKIFGYIQKNPGKVRGARRFFTYYLDTACAILGRYGELERQGVKSPEISQSMARAARAVGLLADAVEKQLANLLQNDVFDLETELAALEETMKSEGIGNEK